MIRLKKLRKLTFTGQAKRKWFKSWNLSMSYSLMPQSLLDAMKWIPPLQNSFYIKMHSMENWIQFNSWCTVVTLPRSVIYLNSICNRIFIICGPGTEAYSIFIQSLPHRIHKKLFSLTGELDKIKSHKPKNYFLY